MMALGYPAVAPILGRPAGRVFLASRARLARTVTGLGGRAYGRRATAVRCCEGGAGAGAGAVMRTCKNCKGQFDPSLNHPRACRFHTAHFGGETKRKFESVYVGGTLDTPDSGKVFQYWHCCGSENPFDPGCTAAPHSPYDD